MSENLVIQGRELRAEDIGLIRGLLCEHPDWTRTRISQELCCRWDWRNARGQFKDMAARTLLLKLERAGLVELPVRRRPCPNGRRNRHVPLVDHSTDPIRGGLRDLQPLSVSVVEPGSEGQRLFNCLLSRYHYLGHRNTVGENLRYLARDHKGRPVGCALFGSAAWKCSPRDAFVGWDPRRRETNLGFLTNNTRFLVLPWVEVPHLASHLLACLARRVRSDWQNKYGHPIHALETFVDRSRFQESGPETVVRVLLEMDARIHALEQQVQDLTARLEASEGRVKTLEDQLAKNSRNSSKPPSTDAFNKPKPKSLRGKSGRPSGGQQGHSGHTLQRVENPNRVEVHRIHRCTACGRSLAHQVPEHVEIRQVHDLPPRRLIVTDHQAEQKRCSCGHINKALFPEGVNAPVQYGPEVRALAVYLHHYQLLPSERTCELLRDLFGCSMSEGTLANIIAQCHGKLRVPVEEIKEYIAQARIIHFDETGSRVEKKLSWLHSASTENATYYHIHPNRGTKAHEAIGILPTFSGRAVHDAYHSYLTYDCPHGLCNAHHLRELTFVDEQLQQGWAGQMKRLLQDMHKATEQAKLSGVRLTRVRIKRFENRYQHLLDDGYAVNPLPPATMKQGRTKKTKARNLLERLDHHRAKVLAFLHDPNVPFDNNLAERDIRMMKVQQKVSGAFRTSDGAESFCRIRSYISTARKNAIGALEALAHAFAGTPFIPAPLTTKGNLDTS